MERESLPGGCLGGSVCCAASVFLCTHLLLHRKSTQLCCASLHNQDPSGAKEPQDHGQARGEVVGWQDHSSSLITPFACFLPSSSLLSPEGI